MIKHIVWWTLKEEEEGCGAAENALRIKREAEALLEKCPTLNSIEVSVAIQPTTTVAAEVVLQSSHDDTASLNAYNEHPEHQKLVAFIKKVVSSRNAIDYEI